MWHEEWNANNTARRCQITFVAPTSSCSYPNSNLILTGERPEFSSSHPSCSVVLAPRPTIPYSRIQFAGLGYLCCRPDRWHCDGKEAEMVNWESRMLQIMMLQLEIHHSRTWSYGFRATSAFGSLSFQRFKFYNRLPVAKKNAKFFLKNLKPGYLVTSLNNYLRKPRKPRKMVRIDWIATYIEMMNLRTGSKEVYSHHLHTLRI